MHAADHEHEAVRPTRRGRLSQLWAEVNAPIEEAITRQVALDNLRRIRVTASLVVLISIVSLTLFTMMEPVDPVEDAWRSKILIGHAVLLPLAASVSVLLSRRSWREPGAPSVTTATLLRLSSVAIVLLLLGGSYFAWADQAVTDSITPFVIVCVIVGLLILVPPVRAVLFFGFGAAVFAVLLGSVAGSDGVAVSNQVNGVGTAMLGLMLALVRHNGEVRVLRQQAEIEAQREELLHTASHDELTGLVNRRQANLIIARELHRQQRGGTAATLLLLDLDHFKRVNDNLGHPVGDALLIEVGALLRSRLRCTDVAARWGGEEFMILLVDTDPESGRVVAEELRRCLAETRFELLGHDVTVTASIGVALLDGSVDDPQEAAYHSVDEALYAAKRDGRNRVVVAGGPRSGDHELPVPQTAERPAMEGR